ncbi:MAG: hypothetical protein K0V04_00735 [Deltaproteobacteria bacterium]|nr:hypothetical protein [Deltaproteobacteria bacterium]
MAITEELHRLGNSARRLNSGSDELNRLIERIDQLLGQLMIGLDFVFPRPIEEATAADPNGKRVIELSYVGYMRTQRNYHLAIKTVKVLESKMSLATQSPGEITPLLSAPRRLRYAAVDVLPEVVSGLAAQVDEMVGSLERRCETAASLLHNLEQVAAGGSEDSAARLLVAADQSASRRVIVPGDAVSHHGGAPASDGESSGQWARPAPAGDDGRRTIAMGSDSFKDRGSSS